MRRAGLFFVFYFLFAICVFVYAKAKPEETRIQTQNNEWTLCITSFDVSALPSSGRIIGDILARDLVNSLNVLDMRFRSGEETAFYEDLALAAARSAAASALSVKRHERDLLLFQGNADWKYRNALKAAESEIARLEESLKSIEAEGPEINSEPLFKFAAANAGGNWPLPPPEGSEYRFCLDQKADAFLTGTLSEYHGRVLLSIKMYTLHSRSYSYEDVIVYSAEDAGEAVAELSGRVFAELLGREPAFLAVNVRPDDAVVIINGAYAGNGGTPLQGMVPGQAEVEITSENHVSEHFTVDLNTGEAAELLINLTPLSREALTVEAPFSPGSSVYLGGLYLGETPLDLDLPLGQSVYLTVETNAGETGSAIIRDGRVVGGDADFLNDWKNTLVYQTSAPVNPAENRVSNAKHQFYGAWGRFWIALPLSVLAVGISDNYIYADTYGINQTPNLHDKAGTAYYVRGAAYGIIGLTAADLVFRVIRYLYISRSDADPLARFPDENGLPGDETHDDGAPGR